MLLKPEEYFLIVIALVGIDRLELFPYLDI